VTATGPVPSDGPWFRAEGQLEGSPTMIRARQDLAHLFPVPGFGTRIEVRWTCQSPGEDGLPSPSDYEAISAFEHRVVGGLGQAGVLAYVFAHRGVVEYTFYCSGVAPFIDHLNEVLEDQPAMPIEISGEDDPDWTQYRELLNACGIDQGAA